jgi:calcineurin-like phosphoesterase family protein
MSSRPLLILLFLAASCSLYAQAGREIRIGIFTDCQYCDCETLGHREYRLSLAKVDSCRMVLNALSPDAVFHLGDMIDHGFTSYDSILPRFGKFNPRPYLVLGNHDFMVGSRYKKKVLEKTGLKETYYSLELGDWMFIVLNGNDLSFVAPQTHQQKEERDEMIAWLFMNLRTNGMPWNGGIGQAQMAWLKDMLSKAEQNSKKVIVLCHFPLLGESDHTLYNRGELLSLLKSRNCVKAYFNGHNHSGNYGISEGMHLVNFKGMVDTKANSFALVTLTSDSIKIKGFGREPDRLLKIRTTDPHGQHAGSDSVSAGSQAGAPDTAIRQKEKGFQRWMKYSPEGLYNYTSFALVSSNLNWFSGMQTSFGYRFKGHFGIGGGIGIERFANLPTYDYYTANFTLMPVFAEFRYTMLKSKCSPVAAIQGGYKFLVNQPSSQMDYWSEWMYPGLVLNEYYNWDSYRNGGFFVAAEAGVNWRIYRRLGLCALISYSIWSVSGQNNYWIYQTIYMSSPPVVKEWQYTEAVKAYQHLFLFRLGFSF